MVGAYPIDPHRQPAGAAGCRGVEGRDQSLACRLGRLRRILDGGPAQVPKEVHVVRATLVLPGYEPGIEIVKDRYPGEGVRVRRIHAERLTVRARVECAGLMPYATVEGA